MYSIKFRLHSFLAVSIITFGLIIGTIIKLYDTHMNRSISAVKKSNLMTSYTFEAQVHFKRQVQEWKNILLRGHEPVLYKKYYSQFEKEEHLVKENIQKLLPLIKDHKKLYTTTFQFRDLHARLNKKYHEGLKLYRTEKKQSYFAADKYVRGIDREPSQLLDKLIIEIKAYSIKQEEMISQHFKMAQNMAISVSLISSIILTIAFLLALKKFIFRPINNLSKSIYLVTSKDKDLTQRIEDTHCSEFAKITKNLNDFISTIHNMFMEIRNASVNLKEASLISAQVTENTNQSIQKQNRDIVNLNESMKSMTGSIDHIAALTHDAADAADTSSQSATMGNQEVVQIKNLITDLSDNVEHTSNDIQDLAEQFQSINAISDMITSISEQTSLLSLNAAIEAARAGESGRGFAVVADEVRSLAVKTSEATKQIKDTISLIQQKSSRSLETIEHSNKIAADCRSQSSTVESAFTNIIESIQTIVDQNQSIKESSLTQQKLVNNVTNHIEQIEYDLNITTKNTTQNTSDNSDLAQLSVMLQLLINEFKVVEEQENEKMNSEIEADDNIDLF